MADGDTTVALQPVWWYFCEIQVKLVWEVEKRLYNPFVGVISTVDSTPAHHSHEDFYTSMLYKKKCAERCSSWNTNAQAALFLSFRTVSDQFLLVNALALISTMVEKRRHLNCLNGLSFSDELP